MHFLDTIIIMKTREKKHHKYIIYNLHSNAFFRYNHNYENTEKNIINKLICNVFFFVFS